MSNSWPVRSPRTIHFLTYLGYRLSARPGVHARLKTALRIGYLLLLRLSGGTAIAVTPPFSPPRPSVENPEWVRAACQEYDEKTRAWARGILERGCMDSPYPPRDPEGAHDTLRLAGVLPLLAELYRETRSTLIEYRLRKLVRYAMTSTDTLPRVGWDTTTAALRLVAFLRAAEVLRTSGLKVTGLHPRMRNFIENHESVLTLGRYTEPEGNHCAVNATGRAALHFLLRGDQPLSGHFVDEIVDVFRRQFLPDGGHVELTPHYHLQVVELLELLRQADAARGGTLHAISETIAVAARNALAGMVAPDGVPYRFGDIGRPFSGKRSAVTIAKLIKDVPASRASNPLILGDFGMGSWRWQVKGTMLRLAVDFGPLGCVANPGHGHGDALSYCLYVGNNEVVADPGTYRYSDDAEACWFKLPQAHNTVYWPRLPAPKLSRFFRWHRIPPPPRLIGGSPGKAIFDVAREWSVGSSLYRHRRSWFCLPSGLAVLDGIFSTSREPAVLRVAFHPHCRLTVAGPGHAIIELSGRRLHIRTADRSVPSLAKVAYYSPCYGVKCPSTALEWVLGGQSRGRIFCTRFELEQ